MRENIAGEFAGALTNTCSPCSVRGASDGEDEKRLPLIVWEGLPVEKIYEVIINIRCLEFEFIRRDWKVFASEEEATEYGLKVQDELNDGLTPEEKAEDGYYFKYWFSRPIDDIDGYALSVGKRRDSGGSLLGRGPGTRCRRKRGSLTRLEKSKGKP